MVSMGRKSFSNLLLLRKQFLFLCRKGALWKNTFIHVKAFLTFDSRTFCGESKTGKTFYMFQYIRLISEIQRNVLQKVNTSLLYHEFRFALTLITNDSGIISFILTIKTSLLILKRSDVLN